MKVSRSEPMEITGVEDQIRVLRDWIPVGRAAILQLSGRWAKKSEAEITGEEWQRILDLAEKGLKAK